MKKRLLTFCFLLFAISPSFGFESDGFVKLDKNEARAPFDFYVLALSWSPSFCQQNRRNKSLQCRLDKRKAYSFVVHGLWPQKARSWPEFCRRNSRNPRKKIINSMLDIMPSRRLIKHQWKKHGTCTNLSQTDYFKKIRAAYQRVKIPTAFHKISNYVTTSPQKIEQAFIKFNPQLKPRMLAVTCSKNILKEVRICMDKHLNFTSCPNVDKASCRRKKITLPPVR